MKLDLALCLSKYVLVCLCLWVIFLSHKGFPCGSDGKVSAYNEGDPGFDPWVEKFPWRRKWQSTPGFLPGKSHGRRSLVGCSPWGH